MSLCSLGKSLCLNFYIIVQHGNRSVKVHSLSDLKVSVSCVCVDLQDIDRAASKATQSSSVSSQLCVRCCCQSWEPCDEMQSR